MDSHTGRFARKLSARDPFVTWEERMSRNKVDHRAQSDGGRLKNFYRIEKTGGEDGETHEASRSLHKRPLARDGAGRMENYLRIERGITA